LKREREMWKWRINAVLAMLVSLLATMMREAKGNSYPTPPLPLGPIPTASQLAFQEREMAMFFHFGMNTFTDSEWGTGIADPDLFNPVQLDTDQWISVAKAAGFKLVILTVKHHDGFCLWQTKYTNYSVASSSWKNGTGDVVRDFVTSANKAGLKVGIYLSPWDRHDESYGDSLGYNQHYLAQIRELLTEYVFLHYTTEGLKSLAKKRSGANLFSQDFAGFSSCIAFLKAVLEDNYLSTCQSSCIS
jgi:alpha-L-fucosidase